MLLHWVVAALAVGIAAYFVPGVHTTLLGAVILAAVLAGINLFIRPVIALVTLPLTILTLGIFSLIINALLVWFVAPLVPGFTVAGFGAAFIFSLILALINTLFGVRFMRV